MGANRMTDEIPAKVDRRTVLARTAAAAVTVWAAPVVSSFTSPAMAAGSGPPSAEQCLKQSFVVDAQGNPLTFTPGRERSFNVDLGASFSSITSIKVSLHESPADPMEAGEDGAVLVTHEDGSGAGGVIILGSASDPLTVRFSPTGGRPPDSTYAHRFADGKAELWIRENWNATGTYTLLKVEVEVCGTLA